MVSLFSVALIVAGVFRMGLAEDYQNAVIGKYSGKTERMKLTVTEFSAENRATAYFKDGNKKHKVQLIVEGNIELYPGDIVEGEITLSAPLKSKTRFPGQRETFAGNNIFLLAQAENVIVTGEKEKGFYGKIYDLRVYMDSLGEKAFEGDSRTLFNAMIFGDKRLVSDELYSALQASGLNHIAVVSGMHLSVAIAFMTFFAQKIFGKRRIGYVVILISAFLLMLITGAGASVVRAFIMCVLYLLSQILRRDRDSKSSLAFAVLIMTGINPFIIYNVGFALSVLSIMGIFLYNEKLTAFFTSFMPKRLGEVLSVSISAQLAVLPVVVYYFGTMATYSLLTNMLLVPLAGAYVILGMLYILFSFVPFIVPCIKIFSGVIAATCYSVEGFDYSIISFTSSLTVLFAMWTFLLALLYRRPSSRKEKRVWAVGFLLVCAVVFAIPPKTGVSVYTIPYGGRHITAVVNSEGDSFLIDCPTFYDVQPIENPDAPFTATVLTTRELGQLFYKENNIERVFVPDTIYKGNRRERVLREAAKRNMQVTFVKDSEKFQIGNVVLEYIGIDGIKTARAVKMEYDGKTLITLQSYEGNEISKMDKRGIIFNSDYVILPFTASQYSENFLTGKILK